MAVFSIDFSNVADNDVLPIGEYTAIVKKAEYKKSQANNPMINFQFSIADGPHEKRVVFYTLTILPQMMWKVKQVFKAFGIQNAIDLDVDENTGLVQNPEFYGVRVLLKVAHREYNGNTQTDVTNVLADTGGVL